MSCQTIVNDALEMCGHSITQHEGDESGMGGAEPCMVPDCPCQNFTSAVERKTIQKWADSAMFTAEPIKVDEGPKVYLLWMTPDPLAAIAAPSKMYKGEVARSLRDVTYAERREYVEQLKATKLKAPYEFVKFHFLIEGVTRAFTHQMVRQRTAVYAQESLRFAVKEDMPVALPPSLAGTDYYSDPVLMMGTETYERLPDVQRQRIQWDAAVEDMGLAYRRMVDAGMPAEDARGLLPHNTLTRLHYSTDLRALLDHAGNRLCTQAQFEWRLVFAKIAQAIREYNPYAQLMEQARHGIGDDLGEITREWLAHVVESDRWQYEAIADLFRPVCYLTGKCEFKANFDRKCSIRERVDANEAYRRPSSEWHEQMELGVRTWQESARIPVPWAHATAGGPGGDIIPAIFPAEWLLDPRAAR